jgi:ATP-dependent DNA helicase DinG
LRRLGENPFQTYQLPEAVLKFRQGAGRLIRTTRDRGRLVILDPRIVRKPYGRLFLDALPECSVTIHDAPPSST